MTKNASAPKSIFQAVANGRLQARLEQPMTAEKTVPLITEEANITRYVLAYLAEQITVANMRGFTCQEFWEELIKELKAQGGYPCAF